MARPRLHEEDRPYTVTLEGRKTYYRYFPSVTEAMAAAVPSAANSDSARGAVNEQREWLGVSTLAELHSLAENGWPEGIRRMNELRFDGVRPATNIKRRRVRSDQGDELDIHRVYNGQLDQAWQRKSRRVGQAPRQLTLAVCISGNCNLDADALFWRGAALARAADMLTESGYTIRIIAMMGVRCPFEGIDADSMFEVEVKSMDAPLSITQLSTTVCLPGFFRDTGFRLICSPQSSVKGHLGYAMDDSFMHNRYTSGEIVCPQHVSDKESAEHWLSETMAAVDGWLPGLLSA